jgi:hypothetical protein
MKRLILVGVLLVGAALAQDKPKVASVESQNAILEAEKAKSDAELQKATDEFQFQKLKVDWQVADAASKAADAKIIAAISAAYANAGLSESAYNFDPANFTFSLKPKPVEKK